MWHYFGRYARLAQLVEQLIYTEKVGSSNLSSRTNQQAANTYVFAAFAVGSAMRDLKAGVGVPF